MESHGLEMAGPIRSGDGVDAIEIASGTGNVTILTDVEIDGDAQLDGTVKFTAGSPADGKVIIATDGSGTCSWAYASVPTGEIFLFEKDTAVTGYTLLTTHNDGIVYITKGSAAAGEVAGTNKSGGTWTQPTHIHDGLGSETGSHTLTLVEIPSHRHDFNGFNAFTIVGGHAGESHAGKPYVPFTDYQGGGGSHKHDLSGMSADGTPSTWRPYGRNFTRQQKN
jgi:hypothetical protein